MKKRCTALILAAIMLLGLALPAAAAQPVSKPVRITVDPGQSLRTISPQLFGVIQNQGRMGEGAADPEGKPYPGFVEALKTMGATELRYPGGTMGGQIFDWREAIGPISQRKLTYARTNNPGQILNYGVDEMAQMAEACGMTLDLCINSHMLGVKEALQYLAYTTMPANGTPLSQLNPETDLQYWANLRASYGHEKPYAVTRVDIGNEEDWNNGWRSGSFVSLSDRYEPAVKVTQDNQAQALYAFGGIVQYDKVNTITYHDLSANAAVSDGTANQQKRAPYVDIVNNGTCHIYVDDVEWTIVDSLSGRGADASVCAVNYDTGYITFGDGVNGAIPAKDSKITITYQTEHEGYLDYYYAIREKFPGVHISAKISGEEFMQLMGSVHPYDSISYHPLSANQPGKDVADFTEHYYQQMASVTVTMQQEAVRLEKLAQYAGDNKPELILSAYGHAQGNFPKGQTDWHLNLAEGIMCADELIAFIDNGFGVACNFLLNDMPYDPDTTDAPTARRYNAMVYSRLGSDKFIIAPKGLAFSMVSGLSGQTQVAAVVENNPTVPLNGYDPQSDFGKADFPYFPAENARTESLDILKVLSAVDENGNLTLIVVNNHAEEAIETEVALKGYTHTGVTDVSEYNGEKFTTINTPEQPNAVSITAAQKDLGTGGFRYVFPAHSITKFTFRAQKGTAHNCPSASYTDLDGDAWYHEAVDQVLKQNWMTETSKNTFAPYSAMSRAQTAELLWNIAGKPVVNYAMRFQDVDAGGPSAEAIRWAASEQIVQGYSQDSFGPDDLVSREQMMTMLYRFVKSRKNVSAPAAVPQYADTEAISAWAVTEVSWCAEQGVVSHKAGQRFNPTGGVSKAEAAAFAVKLSQLLSSG